MLLIAGIPTEAPTQMVIESAEKLKIPFVIFNQRDADKYEANISFENGKFYGELTLGGSIINLNEITGMYFRMMEVDTLPEITKKTNKFNVKNKSQIDKLSFINSLLINFADVAMFPVTNRPKDMYSNFSKLYQLKYINKAGLGIPDTLISNNPKIVRSLDQSLIFKSISSIRSIVKKLDANFLKRIEDIRNLPTQFQECLIGNNIRVHVVGDELFAAKIYSDSIDYRYAGREGNSTNMIKVKLPKIIENKCISLSKSLNLPLCGIDLFLDNEGNYFCFEVNPSPGYSYFQENTQNLNISDSIVKYLYYGSSAKFARKSSPNN